MADFDAHGNELGNRTALAATPHVAPSAAGRAGWVPWLWFGTLILAIGFYAVTWMRGSQHRGPHPTHRDALNGDDRRDDHSD